jgi:cell division protein ZapA (FtsZ GTPase activity inhibitor)
LNSIIEIKLLGQVYTLQTELDASQAKAVVEHVLKKLEAIEAESRGRSKLDSVILVALDIANDFLEIQQKHGDLIEDIASRSQFLIHKLETGKL